MEPKFKHNCDKCLLVASIEGKDVYACERKFLVSRYGNEVHEYTCTTREHLELSEKYNQKCYPDELIQVGLIHLDSGKSWPA